jgi:hypothetical protein
VATSCQETGSVVPESRKKINRADRSARQTEPLPTLHDPAVKAL